MSEPLVVIDARPSAADIQAAWIDGTPYYRRKVALFLRCRAGAVSLLVFGEPWADSAPPAAYDNGESVIADGGEDAGTIWRALNADGTALLRASVPSKGE